MVPEVESALRGIVGAQALDTICTTSQDVVRRVVNEVMEQASRNYVHIDEVVVRSSLYLASAVDPNSTDPEFQAFS